MVGSIILMLIIPLLGILIMLAVAICVIVVSIMKLIYLYQTAKIFRNFKA